jgi:hypothetical protein
VDGDKFRVARSQDGALLVVSSGSGKDSRMQAWEPATGKILWRQGDAERGAVAASVANGAVYADVGGSLDEDGRSTGETVVVGAATKNVLAAKGPKGEGVPLVTANGYGAVANDKGIWIFAPKPVT